jgi:hypothetical protein
MPLLVFEGPEERNRGDRRDKKEGQERGCEDENVLAGCGAGDRDADKEEITGKVKEQCDCEIYFYESVHGSLLTFVP